MGRHISVMNADSNFLVTAIFGFFLYPSMTFNMLSAILAFSIFFLANPKQVIINEESQNFSDDIQTILPEASLIGCTRRCVHSRGNGRAHLTPQP